MKLDMLEVVDTIAETRKVYSWGQTVSRTTQIPHVEVQAICAEWKIERISKW